MNVVAQQHKNHFIMANFACSVKAQIGGISILKCVSSIQICSLNTFLQYRFLQSQLVQVHRLSRLSPIQKSKIDFIWINLIYKDKI
jgi:hypothetical protein